jgi:tetraacyldisaccharide 4'-kinase
MVNGLTLWGNGQLVPLGPLREPLIALRRADVVVIHHADLVC